MKRLADEEGRKILSKLGTQICEKVVEAQQTHLESLEVSIYLYMSYWISRLETVKRELVSAMIGPVVLTGNLKKLMGFERQNQFGNSGRS